MHPSKQKIYQTKEVMYLKKMQIPEDLKERLADNSPHILDRMRLADSLSTLGYKHTDIADAMQIPIWTYRKAFRVYRCADPLTIESVKDGWLTMDGAISRIREKLGTDCYPEDKLFGAQVIYEHKPVCIYRKDGKCYITASQYDDLFYRIDDDAFVVNLVKDMIDKGYVIRSNLTVIRPDGKADGTLPKHMISAYYNVPLEKIKNVRRRLKPRGKETEDIRLENLSCNSISGFVPYKENTTVHRKGNDIAILRRPFGIMTYTDFTPQMMEIVTRFGAARTRSPDKRLSIWIDSSHDHYLHHLRVALDLYGLPENFSKDDVLAMMERFRAEYTCPEKGMVVDHLDSDCHNDRLSNLVIMDKRLNASKGWITTKIANLDPHYFCWAERNTATTVRLRAGCLSQLKSPIYWIDDVFIVEDYLDEMRRFIKMTEENQSVFRRLEEEK